MSRQKLTLQVYPSADRWWCNKASRLKSPSCYVSSEGGLQRDSVYEIWRLEGKQ